VLNSVADVVDERLLLLTHCAIRAGGRDCKQAINLPRICIICPNKNTVTS
jgi:hypothetical protein